MAGLYYDLECILTDEEKLQRGDVLAELTADIRKLENEKKEAAANMKANIDGKSLEAQHIARVIRQGIEIRSVECREEKDYERRIITIYRTDTGEVVRARPMDISDQQTGMNFEEPVYEDEGEDRHKGKITVLGR